MSEAPRYAPRSGAIPTALPMGMISPATPFVDAAGVLAPVSFRFLFTLWHGLSGDMQALAVQRSAASDEMTEAMRQITNLEQRIAALEARLP